MSDSKMQAVADDLDGWSVELHQRFHSAVDALRSIGAQLGYEVWCTRDGRTI